MGNAGFGTVLAGFAICSATWLVQASSSQPFSMACASEGTLNYTINDTSSLQLAQVTGPLSCPGTTISNESLDLTVDFQ